MGFLRTLGRRAHPEAWEMRTERNRLRKLTQQALRAKNRGDLAASARLGAVLRKMVPSLFEDGGLQEDRPDTVMEDGLYEATEKDVDKPAD